MVQGYRKYMPYRNKEGVIQTGLTEREKMKLEVKYRVKLNKAYYEDYKNAYDNRTAPNEIQLAWLNVHPQYKQGLCTLV